MRMTNYLIVSLLYKSKSKGFNALKKSITRIEEKYQR